MSEVNYPSATESTTHHQMNSPKKKFDSKTLIISLLALGLIGSLFYIWYSKKEEKEKDAQQENIIAQKTTANTDLNQSYEAALVRLDSITGINAKLDSEISNKDGNIAQLKLEIETLLNEKKRTGKLSDQQEATLRNKIAQLNSEIDGYKSRIAELEQQNQQLTNENTVVKRERDSVGNELGSTKQTLEQTNSQKAQLEEKVNVGQTLSASNFSIAGVDEKRSGKEKTTSTAKKVDKLRIGFELDANRIATPGKKEVFVCITSPDGQPVTVEALGSGKFLTREEGEKFFTNKIEVDYDPAQKKYINFDWKQNSDFQKGDYKVEVYQNGFKIGEGKVTLKKGGLFG